MTDTLELTILSYEQYLILNVNQLTIFYDFTVLLKCLIQLNLVNKPYQQMQPPAFQVHQCLKMGESYLDDEQIGQSILNFNQTFNFDELVHLTPWSTTRKEARKFIKNKDKSERNRSSPIKTTSIRSRKINSINKVTQVTQQQYKMNNNYIEFRIKTSNKDAKRKKTANMEMTNCNFNTSKESFKSINLDTEKTPKIKFLERKMKIRQLSFQKSKFAQINYSNNQQKVSTEKDKSPLYGGFNKQTLRSFNTLSSRLRKFSPVKSKTLCKFYEL